MFSVPDIHRNKTYKYRNICFMPDTPKLGNRKPMRDRCCELEDEPRLWLLSSSCSRVPSVVGSALPCPQHRIPSAHPCAQAELASPAPAQTAGPALFCSLQPQPVELKVMPWSIHWSRPSSMAQSLSGDFPCLSFS